MDNDAARTKKTVLILDKESILATGLRNLLAAHPDLDIIALADESAAGLAAQIKSLRPNIVVVPCMGASLTPAELLAACKEAPAPRLVCVSTDCNTAYVYDLAKVSITSIEDFVALVPAL